MMLAGYDALFRRRAEARACERLQVLTMAAAVCSGVRSALATSISTEGGGGITNHRLVRADASLTCA